MSYSSKPCFPPGPRLAYLHMDRAQKAIIRNPSVMSKGRSSQLGDLFLWKVTAESGIIDERIQRLGRSPTQAENGLEWATRRDNESKGQCLLRMILEPSAERRHSNHCVGLAIFEPINTASCIWR